MFKKLIDLPKSLSPDLRKLISNTFWLFSEKIFQMGLGLLVGVWVARYLGPEDFGLFNYGLAIVGLFTPIATLGLRDIVVRDITRNPDCKDETLGTSFVLLILASLLAFFLATVTILLSNPESSKLFWIILILGVGIVIKSFDIIDYWFQSQVQSKYIVWARNTAYILSNVVKVVLIKIEATVVAFAGALSLEYALTALGMIVVYKFTGNLLKIWKFSLARAKSLIKDSWPLILSGIVIMIYMRTDQIMLGQMLGNESVGIYSAAVKISEMWYFIPIAIVNSVYPSIVQAKDISEKLYYQRIQKVFNLMTGISYGVAILITFISGYVVNILYGESYAMAANVLTIHIWAGLFVSLGVARATWLNTEGLMKFSAATTAVGAVVNVILNVVLIPILGINGAAIATVIAQIFASYLAGAFYPQTRKIFLYQTKSLTLIGWFKK